MAVCIVGMHKMLGQAASLAFSKPSVDVIGAGPGVKNRCLTPFFNFCSCLESPRGFRSV